METAGVLDRTRSFFARVRPETAPPSTRATQKVGRVALTASPLYPRRAAPRRERHSDTVRGRRRRRRERIRCATEKVDFARAVAADEGVPVGIALRRSCSDVPIDREWAWSPSEPEQRHDGQFADDPTCASQERRPRWTARSRDHLDGARKLRVAAELDENRVVEVLVVESARQDRPSLIRTSLFYPARASSRVVSIHVPHCTIFFALVTSGSSRSRPADALSEERATFEPKYCTRRNPQS